MSDPQNNGWLADMTLGLFIAYLIGMLVLFDWMYAP